MNVVHLQGAEQVQAAAREMQSAAESIRQSVNMLIEELQRDRELREQMMAAKLDELHATLQDMPHP